MAISMDETTVGSFWQRLDKIAAVLDDLRSDFRNAGTYRTSLQAVLASLVGGGISASGDIQVEEDIANDLRGAHDRFKQAAVQYASEFKAAAKKLAARHVWNDTNQFGGGLGPGAGGGASFAPAGAVSGPAYRAVLQEIRRQMAAATATVQVCTPAVSAFSAGSTNVGNGAAVSSIKRGDGLTAELIIPESCELRCVVSGNDARGIRHHEEFWCYGLDALDGCHPDWGGTGYGSGALTPVWVIDPSSTGWGTHGNLLINGFESFPASGSVNTPTHWATDGAGTDGVDFTASSAQAYFNSNSLLLLAGTGTNTSFAQYFGDYNSTNATFHKLEGSTQYAYCIRFRSTGTVTAGAMTVALANAASTTINDDQGTANISSAIDLTAVGSGAWTTATGVFRTPAHINSGASAVLGPKLRLRVSTAITGANVYVDSVAFGKMVELYPGGPWVALFAGSTPFSSGELNAVRDFYTITTTNDNGGASHARKTFHRLGDALLDLRLASVLWPSTASENIADSVL